VSSSLVAKVERTVAVTVALTTAAVGTAAVAVTMAAVVTGDGGSDDSSCGDDNGGSGDGGSGDGGSGNGSSGNGGSGNSRCGKAVATAAVAAMMVAVATAMTAVKTAMLCYEKLWNLFYRYLHVSPGTTRKCMLHNSVRYGNTRSRDPITLLSVDILVETFLEIGVSDLLVLTLRLYDPFYMEV
jgi:hypothetical protein